MQHIEELKALNLPVDQFAVFGSGPLAIRNIRKNEDIDLIVKRELWEQLAAQHNPAADAKSIKLGSIEIWKDWKPWFEEIAHLIDDADIIDDCRFVKLSQVIQWKSARGSPKDKEDLDRIKTYFELYGDGMTKAF